MSWYFWYGIFWGGEERFGIVNNKECLIHGKMPAAIALFGNSSDTKKSFSHLGRLLKHVAGEEWQDITLIQLLKQESLVCILTWFTN